MKNTLGFEYQSGNNPNALHCTNSNTDILSAVFDAAAASQRGQIAACNFTHSCKPLLIYMLRFVCSRLCFYMMPDVILNYLCGKSGLIYCTSGATSKLFDKEVSS